MEKKKGGIKPTRSMARAAALQVLFALDQNPQSPADFPTSFLAKELRYPALERFALGLIDGVRSHRDEIDRRLAESAANWSVGRMTGVDRSIMRLAVYELTQERDTPPKVVVNEAIELAKRFSGEQSSRFINGVLNNVLRDRLAESSGDALDAAPEPSPPDSAEESDQS